MSEREKKEEAGRMDGVSEEYHIEGQTQKSGVMQPIYAKRQSYESQSEELLWQALFMLVFEFY